MNFTTIKKSAAIVFALLLMCTLSMPQPAKAQSISQLQQQINQLLAQIAVLQGQLGGSVGTCTATFARSLGVGSTGADVLALQKFLNRSADTRVAVSGAGSPGLETQYYGPATAAAVSKFQVKYRAEILTPSGLVNPTGYFGPSSRAKANALCTVVVPPVENPGDDDDDNNTDSLEGGEARLEDFQTDDGDDTSVSEGQDDAPVMDVEFGVEDGDVQVNRIDVAFDHISGGDDDPWDVFENVSIWVDGDEVASMDVDDDNVWSENQPNSGDYRLRITDIDDYVVREGETAEFTVAVTVVGNVDDAGSVEWETFIPDDGIRAIDSEDINHFVGETDETVRFDIVEAGADGDLVVRTSSDDPDAQVLQLDRSRTSDWLPVFAFELDADDSEDDITINSLPVTVDVSDGETYNALVRDARLVVDGEEYDDVTIDDGGTDTAVLTFDFGRDDLVIDAGESISVELELEFRALSESDEGTRLQASISSAQADEIDAEGREDLSDSQISGSATGELHTLRTGGGTAGEVETSAELQSNSNSTTDDDEGVFTIEFDVTAFDQDVYINNNTARGTTTSTGGVNYIIEDGSGDEITDGSVVANLDSSADTEGDRYFIGEGDTERFTLTVEYNPDDRGFYRLQLYTINYNDTEANPDVFQRVLPENRFETKSLSI